jgi:hypothetical protein
MSASGTAVFVGQAAELGLLRKSLAAAHRSQPRIVVVEGLPTIGKSTLLRSPKRWWCVNRSGFGRGWVYWVLASARTAG